MKESNHITKKESKTLKILLALALLFTVASISSKFINGYNQAIREEQLNAEVIANNLMSFYISDCYKFFNHPALFAVFSGFILLFSLVTKKFTKSFCFSVISFSLLSLSILQATYLHIWFAEIVKIEWNSTLILPDVFDVLLCFCFAILLILQLKIIYRFAREKFHAKIS